MIKIKDNFNLKELEKFGFNEVFDEYVKSENLVNSLYRINKESRRIYILVDSDYESEVYFKDVDLLFDLINAGVVEKVKG